MEADKARLIDVYGPDGKEVIRSRYGPPPFHQIDCMQHAPPRTYAPFATKRGSHGELRAVVAERDETEVYYSRDTWLPYE